MVSGLRFCWPLGGPYPPRFAAAVPGLLALLTDEASISADKPATNNPFDGVDLPDTVEESAGDLCTVGGDHNKAAGDLCIDGGDHSEQDDLCIDGGAPYKPGDLCNDGDAHSDPDDLCNDGGDPGKAKEGSVPFQKTGTDSAKESEGLVPTGAKQGSAPDKNGYNPIIFSGALLQIFHETDDEGVCAVHAADADSVCDVPAATDADSSCDAHAAYADSAQHDSDGEGGADPDVESDSDHESDSDDESDDEEEPDHESDSDEDYDAAHESETAGGEPSDEDEPDPDDDPDDAAFSDDEGANSPSGDDSASAEHADDTEPADASDAVPDPEYDAESASDDDVEDVDADFDADFADDVPVAAAYASLADAQAYAAGSDEPDAGEHVTEDAPVSIAYASLAKYFFSPLRGSNGGQGQAKYFTYADADMKPKSRFKMKAELLSFYLMKGLLDPGILWM